MAASPRQLSPSARVARGALALLSTQPLTWSASLLLTIFVPRYLGDRGLGGYAAAWTIAQMVGTIVALGVPNYLIRRVATAPTRTAIEGNASLVLLVGIALCTAAVLSALAPLLGLPVPLGVLRILLAGVVITTAQSVLSSLLIGQERNARYAWLNAAVVVGGACAGVAVLASGAGINAYVGTIVVISAILFALGWHYSGFRLQPAAVDPRLWRSLVLAGLPFLAWNIATQVRNQIDVVLVAALAGQQVAGWLAAAYRIVLIPIFIPILIQTPLLPALSRHVGEKQIFQQTLRRSVAAVLILSVPTSAAIIALAPAVPSIFHWPAPFQHSVVLMRILACEQPLMAMDMLLGTALIALHDERRWLRVALAGAVFNPALNLFLIPFAERMFHNGGIGAALVELATELLIAGGIVALLPRGTIDRNTIAVSARVVLAGSVLLVIMALVRPWSWVLALPAGGLAFVAAGAALGVLRPDDLRELAAIATQSLNRRVARSGG